MSTPVALSASPYRHTCSILDSPAERLADVATFTQASLARHERVALLGMRRDSALLSAHLSALGVDTTAALATGALVIASDADSEEFFSLAPSRIDAHLDASADAAARDGWSGFALSGLVAAPGVAPHEEALTRLVRHRVATVHCPYLHVDLVAMDREVVRACHDAELVPRWDSDARVRALQAVCRHLVTGLPVDSAAITVATTNRNRRVLAASDPMIIRIERLQHTLGEGPGITAFTEAITAQMDTTVDGHPWPVFAAAIASERIGSLAALPLRIGRAHSSIGTLLLCRRDPGVLSQATVGAAEGWATTIGAMVGVFTLGRRAPDSAWLG